MTGIHTRLWRARHLLLAGVALLAFFTILQAIERRYPETAQVLVARRNLSAGHVLSGRDVEARTVAGDLIPENALSSAAEASGQRLAANIPAGYPLARGVLLSQEFLRDPPAGHVVVAVRVASDGTGSFIEPGNFIGLYAPAPEHSTEAGAIRVVERAAVVGIGEEEKNAGMLSEGVTYRVLYLVVREKDANLIVGYAAADSLRAVLVAPP
ncbi:SAF domain-containing protein [Actinotignum sp. GS-2025b]|uniref:SAF domain-containing protein n=1 Tax=Actinotignum sp. GS-2025b TaxID=3427275 RepID=UPI003F47BDDE